MNRSIKITLLLVTFLLTLSGCFVQSLHPLTDETEFIEGLAGSWEGEEGTWYFLTELNHFRIYMGSDDQPYPDRDQFKLDSYWIFYVREIEGRQDTTIFSGNTVELNDNYYLDLYPFSVGGRTQTENIMNNDLLTNHFSPVHTFSRINVQGDQVSIEPFDDAWIREQIITNRIRLKHELIGGGSEPNVILTASTEELQEFVIKYGNEENAYQDPVTLNRIQ